MRTLAKGATVAAIESYIRTNGLTPGDPLPSESTLCELLQVSRSSIREAMRTLASLDVVEVRHGHGTYVGQMSLAPLVNGLVLRLTLNDELALQNLTHVLHTRIALDLANAEELVNHCAGKKLDKLRGIVQEMRNQFELGRSIAEQDHQFHTELTQMLSNPLMQELSMALWEIHTVVVPKLGIGSPEDMHQTVDAHARMIEALEAGDVERYKELIDVHYGPLRRAIEKQQEAHQ